MRNRKRKRAERSCIFSRRLTAVKEEMTTQQRFLFGEPEAWVSFSILGASGTTALCTKAISGRRASTSGWNSAIEPEA
jgi:hypothetical protein